MEKIRRIRDIIDVPEVKTVIQLAEIRDLDPEDAINRVDLETLFRSFVVTEDIKEILQTILPSLLKNTGKGFFITGNYGSGKSHFLSVLGLLIRHAWTWPFLIEQSPGFTTIREGMEHRNLLTVLIPLSDFGSDLNLEDILWHEIEKTAAIAGIPLALSHTQRFISLFNRYLRPVHRVDFERYLETRLGREYSWDRICREDPPSAHALIYQFMAQKRELLPFRVVPDNRAITSELLASLSACGCNGLVIIMDELSEFLRSRADPKTLSQDARFLQFMGEASADQPIWIVASIQETLERIGEIDESVFKKIKARYSQRLRLTSKHLREIIAGRLIKYKSQKSRTIVESVYDQLARSFAHLPISKPEFLRIYPVHPETIELLDKNSDLFSQQRGAVDFLSSRIRGRPEDQIQGMMDEPVDHLLTPDVMFDHFQDRLAESPRFSRYFHLLHDHFHPRVQMLFPDNQDAKTAMKLLKILILLHISPLNERRTARDLANIVLFQSLDPSIVAGDINYQYIHDRILRPIHDSAGHIRLTRGETPLDDIFEIDLEHDMADTIEASLRKIISETSPLAGEVLDFVYSSLAYGQAPLAFFYQHSVVRDAIRWDNTFRRISVCLCDFESITEPSLVESRKQLQNLDVDLAVFIGKIGCHEDQFRAAQRLLLREPEPTAASLVFILPQPEQVLIDDPIFRESYALNSILAELTRSGETITSSILDSVKRRSSQSLQQAHKKLLQLYSDIIIMTASETTPYKKAHFEHIDKWFSSVLTGAFAARYPDHHRIAPGIEVGSRMVVNQTIDRLINPGQLTPDTGSRDAALVDTVKSILLPLGLAIKTGEQYQLSVSRHSAAAKALVNWLPKEADAALKIDPEVVAINDLFLTAARSKYGFSSPVFEITMAVLIRKGFISAFSNRQPIPFNSIPNSLMSSITHVARGNLIPIKLRPVFNRLYKAVTGRHLKEFDIDIQIGFFQKIIGVFHQWKEQIELFRKFIHDIVVRYGDPDQGFQEILGILQTAETIISSPSTDQDTSSAWQQLLETMVNYGDFEAMFAKMKNLASFLETKSQVYLEMRSYLHHTGIRFPETGQAQGAQSAWDAAVAVEIFGDHFVFSDGHQNFMALFDRFIAEYRLVYQQAHDRYYEALNKIRYDEIFSSVEFQAFQRLCRVHALGTAAEFTRIMQFIETQRNTQCNSDLKKELMRNPVCHCGYLMTGGKKVFTAANILSRLRIRVKELFEILTAEPLLEQLKAIISRRKQESALDKILNLDTSMEGWMSELNDLMTPELIERINKETVAHRRILVRNLNDLQNLIGGKILIARQLRDIFDRWMAGSEDIGTDDYIQIDDF